MPRPRTKTELQAACYREFDRLWAALQELPEQVRVDSTTALPIEDQSRNARDVLAHLHEWHLMMLRWHNDGMAGRRPEMPAPGYTWRELPRLNAAIWQAHRDTSYPEAERLFRDSHERLLQVIEGHSDEELFTRRRYPWTGSTSLGSYLVSATSSHYIWAVKTVRALLKAAVTRDGRA